MQRNRNVMICRIEPELKVWLQQLAHQRGLSLQVTVEQIFLETRARLEGKSTREENAKEVHHG